MTSIFILGFLAGMAFSVLALAPVFLRRKPQQPRRETVGGPLARRKMVDGIWTEHDERPGRVVYDGTSPRVRKAVIRERSRRG